MRRFFVPFHFDGADRLCLPDDFIRHAATVLRMSEGDQVLLLDGKGGKLHCRIESFAKGAAFARVLESFREEPDVLRVHLLQGLPKGDKMELVLQKGTELGVSSFTPVATSRSILRLEGGKAESRRLRWEKIAQEAARQSQSDLMPLVAPVQSLRPALEACSEELKLVLYEGECSALRYVLPPMPPASVAILIGPEGGLSPDEIELTRSFGFEAVSLGGRVLRTETAGFAVVAILRHLYADLG